MYFFYILVQNLFNHHASWCSVTKRIMTGYFCLSIWVTYVPLPGNMCRTAMFSAQIINLLIFACLLHEIWSKCKLSWFVLFNVKYLILMNDLNPALSWYISTDIQLYKCTNCKQKIFNWVHRYMCKVLCIKYCIEY